MKKIVLVFALFAALIFVVSCGGNNENNIFDNDSVNTSTGENSEEYSDADTGNTRRPEGIYLGIIGFNYKLNIKDISILTDTSMPEFHAFIDDELPMDDATALYYADYEALKMMQNYTPVPPKLANVALVTFTDGLDTASDGPNDPENYGADYPDAIHGMIVNASGIHGHPVEAYSIGLQSNDIGEGDENYKNFMSRLRKLASSDSNAVVVENMTEVKARFNEIAENLHHVFKTIDIDVKVLGNYPDGTRMRFTFDIKCDHEENICEKNGSNSTLYIEATYRRSNDSERSFDNFSYYGFSGSLKTVKCGERDEKGFYPCKFENLQYNDMDTEIKQIELWKQNGSEWNHENESLKKEYSDVKESKSSALIMLVLDCTTSLGRTKFEELKDAAKEFITILVNGATKKGFCGNRFIDNGETCDGDAIECTALDAGFTGGFASCNTSCTAYDTSTCKFDNGVTTTSCDPNPCTSIANSTGICSVNGSSYVCGCKSGYTWNGYACTSSSTPCDDNPCTIIANSTGICSVNGSSYVCGCKSGYNWNGYSCTTLPECSKSSGTPCYDSTSHLTWSKISPSDMKYIAAIKFCSGSEMNGYGGFTDWRLPTIDELKTLLVWSKASSCKVSEANSCLSWDSCWTCSTCMEQQDTPPSSGNSCDDEETAYDDGRFSKLGDAAGLWSSSLRSDNSNDAWYVNFYYGDVDKRSQVNYSKVRCVR